MFKEERILLTNNVPSNAVSNMFGKMVNKKHNLKEADVILYAVLDKKLKKEGKDLVRENEQVTKNL